MAWKKPITPGTRFGRLLVLANLSANEKHQLRVFCACDCGVFKILLGIDLRKGHTNSCGCLRREISLARATVHGHTKNDSESPEFNSWHGMLARCTRRSHKSFADYGGRGITVCPRWKDFRNFLEDMGPRPVRSTLERKDNNKGYSPDNCRWATAQEQSSNKRNNRRFLFNGAVVTMSSLAKLMGVNRRTLHDQIETGKVIVTEVPPTS